MKTTLSRLKSHLDTDAPARHHRQAPGHARSRCRERSRPRPPRSRPFRVAHVVSAEPHPNAERLRVCIVDTRQRGACRSSAARPMPAPACAASSSRSARPSRATGLLLKQSMIRGVASNACCARPTRWRSRTITTASSSCRRMRRSARVSPRRPASTTPCSTSGDAQPGRLSRRPRHRPRSRSRRSRPVDPAQYRADRGQFRQPDLGPSRDARPQGLSALHRADDPRRQERAEPALVAGPADRDRAAPDAPPSSTITQFSHPSTSTGRSTSSTPAASKATSWCARPPGRAHQGAQRQGIRARRRDDGDRRTMPRC